MTGASASTRLTIRGQTFELLADRAVHWRETGTVIIADIHLGKAAAFRSSGFAIPEGDTGHDLARIDRILRSTGAVRLVVVGDMFHAPSGFRPEVIDPISNWRDAWRGLDVLLVPGNHDRALRRMPADWRFDLRPCGFRERGLRFVHDAESLRPKSNPQAGRTDFIICGHIHPGISLAHRHQSSMKAPCFWLAPHRLVLPAFGRFTGLAAIRPDMGDHVYAIDSGRLIEVPAALW
jgi:DNA ligase-associated metallophosphoesterase